MSRKMAVNSGGGGVPKFTYTGTYTLVKDTATNWRIKFLTSGTFTPERSLIVDLFAVGGGGSCDNLDGGARRSGGGGGYTQTVMAQSLIGGTPYTVTVGYGGGTQGTTAANGGPSSFGDLITALGGSKGASYSRGGAGGSGGAGCSSSAGLTSAVGGSDGADGENGGGTGGAGQGTTTREFGELTGDLYAGGGGGAPGAWAGGDGGGGAGDGTDGADNTGGGGGAQGGRGGSGIVIIRNAR